MTIAIASLNLTERRRALNLSAQQCADYVGFSVQEWACAEQDQFITDIDRAMVGLAMTGLERFGRYEAEDVGDPLGFLPGMHLACCRCHGLGGSAKNLCGWCHGTGKPAHACGDDSCGDWFLGERRPAWFG